MKDPVAPIRNRARDFPRFSAVPRQTTPPSQFPLTHLVMVDCIFYIEGAQYSNETLTPHQSVTSTNVTWRGVSLIRVDRYTHWKRSVCLLLCVVCVCCRSYFKPSILQWIRKCRCVSVRCRNFQYVWMITCFGLVCQKKVWTVWGGNNNSFNPDF